MKRVSSSASAVDLAAAELRDAAVGAPDGSFLGSEESLALQLGVSGPTLRQAARLLEAEQLLQIRRGIGGGYYVRRPTMSVVATMAATYMRTQAVDLESALLVVGLLIEPMNRLAARCTDPALREELAGFERRIAASPPPSAEHEFGDLLSRMGGNIPLRIMLTIINTHGEMRRAPRSPPSPEQKRYRALRTEQIAAVLAGDEDNAARIALERFELLKELIRARNADDRTRGRQKAPAR